MSRSHVFKQCIEKCVEQKQRACIKTLCSVSFERIIRNMNESRYIYYCYKFQCKSHESNTNSKNILPSDHVASKNDEPTTSESTEKRGKRKSNAAKTATSTEMNSSNVDSSIDIPVISSQTLNNTQSSTSSSISRSRTVIGIFILHFIFIFAFLIMIFLSSNNPVERIGKFYVVERITSARKSNST